MLPSNTCTEIISSNIGAPFFLVANDTIPYTQRLGSPMSHGVNSLLINGQLEVLNLASSTSSTQSTSQCEFEGLPPPSDGEGITSPTGDSVEGDELQANDDSDVDKRLRKRQKTQTGSTAANGLSKVKSQDKRYTLAKGGSRKCRLPRQLRLGMPATLAVAFSDACANRTSLLAAEKKAEPISLNRGSSVREEKKEISISNHSRRRINGPGLLVPRLGMSKSSLSLDSLNSGSLKDHEEPPRGLALRHTNLSHGSKLGKSQGRKINQGELELWTKAEVAHITFRKSHELGLRDKVEEENIKRNVSHMLTCLMETEAERSNKDMARNEGTTSKIVQNQLEVAMPDSSIHTRCDDLVEEIFGPGSQNRGMSLLKPKTSLVKKRQSLERSRASSNTDSPTVTHTHLKVTITNTQLDDEKEIVTSPGLSANRSLTSEVPTTGVDQTVHPPTETGGQLDFSDILAEGHSGEHQLFRGAQNLYSEDVTVLGKRTREEMIVGEKKTDMTIRYALAIEDAEEVDKEDEVFEEEGSEVDGAEMDEFKLLETPSKAPEWTKIVKKIQPVDELGVAITSNIEREQVENALRSHYPSIDNDGNQEGEETRREANSPQVLLRQLGKWSTTLRSLIKGKKKFQHQDLINLKNTLQEIYNKRAHISATSSLAQEVYEVSQLEVHDVPNKDELGLRALARKSTRYWGIRRQRHA